jgi:Methane oxygenase PmoA
VGGWLFTRYDVAAAQTRPNFHPTIGPGGVRVTRSFPMEPGYEGRDESTAHPHHTGIYVAHCEVNGVNHWGGRTAGRQLHEEFGAVWRGPVYAGAQEHLEWVAQDGTPTLSERRAFAVYNLPGEERLVDVTATLIATYGPVDFGDTKEAGLISVRVASSMEGKRGQGLIESAFGGRREPETWGKPAPWCHYSGPVGDTIQGIGIFDHPTNPRYPTNWHVRDYGLFSANCFGYHDYFPGTERDGSLHVSEGQSVTFRYRLHFHRGDAAAGKTDQRWADFALPPAVGVEG